MSGLVRAGDGVLENEKVIHEVCFCGYGEYRAAIDACDKRLPKALGKTEVRVLQRMKERFHGQMTTVWSKTLLFGDVAKGLTKVELAALVMLVRRGLVKVSMVPVSGVEASGLPAGGYRHLWECDKYP
jgi:hypothetical protein